MAFEVSLILLFVLAGYDALLEPLAYWLSLWTWRLPAPYLTVYYFNAPAGNCIG